MSIVTDPVILDRTGQDISAKLQKIVDAINGGTIDPLTVEMNGVYTPSEGTIGYAPVTVNIPTAFPMLTQSEWDALTTAEKQAYGLVAIITETSGFDRGELVYGADYSPFVPVEEMVPTYSWNASDNAQNIYYFSNLTLSSRLTTHCLAFMAQNGISPAWTTSNNLLPPIANGNSGNGNWAICYGDKVENDYASTYSSGNNWNNSEIVCFCFSDNNPPTVIETFYEQGQTGTYTYSYTATGLERLLLVVMLGGQTGGPLNVAGLTLQSHVISSGARFNDVYFGELSNNDTVAITVSYSAGANSNGSLFVALLRMMES